MTTILVMFFFHGASGAEGSVETTFPATMAMSRALRRMRRKDR